MSAHLQSCKEEQRNIDQFKKISVNCWTFHFILKWKWRARAINYLSTSLLKCQFYALTRTFFFQGKPMEMRKLIEKEKAETGRVKFSIYTQYFKSMGIFRYFIPFIGAMLINAILQMIRQLWLTAWWDYSNSILMNKPCLGRMRTWLELIQQMPFPFLFDSRFMLLLEHSKVRFLKVSSHLLYSTNQQHSFGGCPVVLKREFKYNLMDPFQIEP